MRDSMIIPVFRLIFLAPLSPCPGLVRIPITRSGARARLAMAIITQCGLDAISREVVSPHLRQNVLTSTGDARLCTVTMRAPPMRLRGTTMTHEYQYSSKEAQALHDLIVERGRHIARGIHEIKRLRKVFEHAVREASVVLEWDPSTPPALRERLTVMGLSMVNFSFVGLAAGSAVGAFTNKPLLYTALGTGIAMLLGALHGHLTVQSGWRLRGYHDADGVECVEIIVESFYDTTAS